MTKRLYSTSSPHPKNVQQRVPLPGSMFEFMNDRFSGPILSFRLKAMKHFRGPLGIQSKPQRSAVSIANRKRSKHAHVRPPPRLANDLALMQFTGGGNIETHIKRIMEEQAKEISGSRGVFVGIADVYRDSSGGIWWDADEEVEYAHLLDGVDRIKAEGDAEEALWEDFEGPAKNCSCDQYERRSSTESTSSADSNFDLKYLIPPPEVDSYPTFTSGELNDRVLASFRVGGEGMNALSLPSRPSRQTRHLLRSVSLIDLQAFGKPKQSYSSSESPLSAQISSDRNPGEVRARADRKPKGAVRRRVPPLNPHGPSSNVRNLPGSAPSNAVHFEMDATRMQFIKDSFSPLPSISTLPTRRSHKHSLSISSRSSRNGASSKLVRYPSSIFSIRAWLRKRGL